jgi:O-antigen/teichoic acid export membrane protein
VLSKLTSRVRSSAAISSGIWVLFGLFSQQGIRLMSNLIMTRILIPEHFGLMALVTSTMVIFLMLSDIGLNKSVINSDRTKDPVFMNTAWTLQVLQASFVASLVVCFSYPVSLIYEEPLLTFMLLVTAFTVFCDGFRSIAVVVSEKELKQKNIVLMELGAQLLGLIAMLVFALTYRSVWALIVGYAVNTLSRTTMSYLLFGPHFSRFRLDKESAKDILNFGKWIFISSFFGLVTSQADVLIMGIWMTMEELGKYAIAAIFAGVITMVANRVSIKVLHPHYRKLVENEGFIDKLHRTRFKLNAGLLLICSVVAIFGDILVQFLYDERYRQAGWMLQFLALGKYGHCLTVTLRPLLFSKGDSFSSMLHQICLSVLLASGMIVGAWHKGALGLIIAYALVPVLVHPILIFAARKHDFYCFRRDLVLAGSGALLVFSCWYLMGAKTLEVLFL